MRAKHTFVESVSIAAFLLPALTSAEQVRVSYEATVSAIEGSGFGYAAGDPLTGWFSFDSDDLMPLGVNLYSESPIESDLSSVIEIYDDCTDITAIIDLVSSKNFTIQDISCDLSGQFTSEASYELDAYNLPASFSLPAILSGPLVLDGSGGQRLTGERYEFGPGMPYNSIKFDVSKITFEVITPTVQQLLSDLVSLVMTINTQAGISNSLDGKLTAALYAIDDENQNNDGAALNAMYAFCSYVSAQSGNRLSEADAGALIAAANGVISALDESASLCP